MSKYFIYFLFFLFSLFLEVFSQGENNNWYFGDGAGINFNTSPVTILSNGQTDFLSGSASISCPNGNLMFYSDGISIWDKNHNIMPNGSGLLGHNISFQSAIIVPQPQTPNIYYVFTVDFSNGTDGFNYSIVDMTLNGGLGDVTTKNIQVNSNTSNSSKLTATFHANGTDVWVLIEDYVDYEIESYLLSSTGFNMIPVISPVLQGTPNPSRKSGVLKFSSDGSLLANTAISQAPYVKFVEVFNFDNATGMLTFSDSVGVPNNKNPQGIEFSPDGTKLYFTNQDNTLYQTDLSSSPLSSSRVVIATYTSGMKGLQLGPDGLIYVNHANETYISGITSPNLAGLACNYVDTLLDYSATTTSVKWATCQLIVGKVITDYQSDFTYVDTCFNQNTYFTTISNKLGEIDSVLWNFDDPISVNNSSVSQNPNHIFTSTGTYDVELIIYYSCDNDTILKTLTITNGLVTNITGTLSFCTGDSTELDAGLGFASYAWSNGDGSQTSWVKTAGDYSVMVTNASGCQGFDTVTVVEIANIPVTITGTLSFCTGDSTKLDAGAGFTSYLWSNGDGVQTSWVDVGGDYSVIITNTSGCQGFDTVSVVESANIPVVITGALSFCSGDSTELDAGSGFASYFWSNGDVTQTSMVDVGGDYSVIVTNALGCQGFDTVTVVESANIPVTITGTLSFCTGDSTKLDAGAGFTSYLWSNGDGVQTSWVDVGGDYSVIITNTSGCQGFDTVSVVESANIPVVITGALSFCSGDSTELDAGSGFASYLWSNGDVTQTSMVDVGGDYSVIITNTSGCQGFDTVSVNQTTKDNLLIRGDLTYCIGDVTVLNAGDGYTSYLWNNGSTNQVLPVFIDGAYFVQVIDVNGCLDADTVIVQSKVCNVDTCVISIPNSFSPNKDGFNDKFGPVVYDCEFVEFNFFIFNRWGELVFKGLKPGDFWDGSYKGESSKSDVYSWVISYRYKNEVELETKIGHVLVIK